MGAKPRKLLDENVYPFDFDLSDPDAGSLLERYAWRLDEGHGMGVLCSESLPTFGLAHWLNACLEKSRVESFVDAVQLLVETAAGAQRSLKALEKFHGETNDPFMRKVLLACRRRLEQLAKQDDPALDAYYKGANANVPLFATVMGLPPRHVFAAFMDSEARADVPTLAAAFPACSVAGLLYLSALLESRREQTA